MHVDELWFELPDDRIAARPLERRSASRLLVVPRHAGDVQHCRFAALSTLLAPGDLVIVNDTRVVRARLFGRKPSGGAVELLLCDPVDEHRWWALAKGARRLRPGSTIAMQSCAAVVEEVAEGGQVLVRFAVPVAELCEREGHVPLPPYIARPDDALDGERYQTVFAHEPGAVAAPTAALHFDAAVLAGLQVRGVELCKLTLHVGPGTFMPVRTQQLDDHKLMAERYVVGPEVAAAIARARARQGRVVAVGTTVTRTLETLADGQGGIHTGSGKTELFIKPGFQFQVVDALVTNFHLPGSTLLALVMAFAGRERVLAAYRTAIAEGYRFYSYGDAMLIL